MSRDAEVLAVLHRLEAEHRRIRRIGGAALCALAVVVCGAAVSVQGRGKQEPEPAIQNLLRTRRLEIANSNGEVVAVLQAVEPKDEPGWLTVYHDNGRRKWRAQMGHNRYEGAYTAWWPSGIKSEEGTYDRGRKHGLFTTYHENGQPKERGAYGEGKRTGIWTGLHDNGEKAAEGLYEDDLRVGPWKFWHANGRVARTVTFQDGAEDGAYVEWYDNGQKRYEGQMAGGVRTGAIQYWYPNGQLREAGAYDDRGKQHGEWKYWRDDGTLDERRSTTYEHGVKVKR